MATSIYMTSFLAAVVMIMAMAGDEE